jgi:carboxyl-terminal processing protease
MRITMWLLTFLLLLALTVSPGPGTAGKETNFEALKRFSQVLDMVEQHYVKDIPRAELIRDAIKGLLEQLDPHSAYLTEEDFKDIQDSTAGRFEGIGIEISLDNGRLTVVSPIEDTPAYKAGLRAGDLILEIDGQTTQDMSLTDAVKRIKGPKGTSVTLVILHKGSKAPEEVTITRGTIPIVSVKTLELERGVVHLRVTRFSDTTTRDLRDQLKDFAKKAPLRGIVLDLRNNPGGLLEQAVSVTDTFLAEGLIVYIQGKDKSQRKDFAAHREPADILDVPIVCMINSGSASASEIVAGALQDTNRALILGEKTFGKGSVQTVIPLADGAGIKLTTALYYTPKGRSIQAEGIVPDLEIPFVPARDDDADISDLRKRFTIREKDLSGHLENNVPKKEKKTRESDTVKTLLAKDNQLRLALELVKQLPKIRQIR